MRPPVRAVAAALIVGACGILGAQGVTFTSRRDTVRLDVLVTRAGVPVPGLTAADFEVRDNGVVETIESAAVDPLPINAILAFDMSTSVAGERLIHLQAAGRALLTALAPADRAALVTFNQSVVVAAPLTNDLASVRAALDRTSGLGETSLLDGAYVSLRIGEGGTARSLVMVFSDGVDSSSWLESAAVLDAAARGHSVVYAIAEGRGKRPPVLADLTHATGGSLVEIASTADLDALFLRVLAEFRLRYVVTYSLPDVPAPGRHRLDVRVKGAAGRGVAVRTRPGYQTGPRE